MSNEAMTRTRVLLVEDEAMVAMLMEDMLADLDCEVAATAARLDEAVELARSAAIDVAFIDVNLRGVPAYPVAEALRARGIPFAFVTGYGAAGADPAHGGAPVLQKPFRSDQLEAILRGLRGR